MVGASRKANSAASPKKMQTKRQKKGGPVHSTAWKSKIWFTEEEDLMLSRAFVGCSTNPLKGCNQTSENFWIDVKKRFDNIMATEVKPKEKNERSPESCMNRFQWHTAKHVSYFNKYYNEIKCTSPSGWTTEDFVKAAVKKYWEAERRPFKFPLCVPVLHQMPKFDPKAFTGFEEDCQYSSSEDSSVEDGTNKEGNITAASKHKKHNTLGWVQGDRIQHPIGVKVAKKKMQAYYGQDSTTSHTDLNEKRVAVMDDMVRSTQALATTMATKQRHDTWMKLAQAYIDMGEKEQAKVYLNKIVADQNGIEVMGQHRIPGEIAVEKGMGSSTADSSLVLLGESNNNGNTVAPVETAGAKKLDSKSEKEEETEQSMLLLHSQSQSEIANPSPPKLNIVTDTQLSEITMTNLPKPGYTN